jgi:hypothetical protein
LGFVEERSRRSGRCSEVTGGWWAARRKRERSDMALGAKDARHLFTGKRGEGLTFKQFELMARGSLLDRFKKLQRDVGNPTNGAMFKGRYCI